LNGLLSTHVETALLRPPHATRIHIDYMQLVKNNPNLATTAPHVAEEITGT